MADPADVAGNKALRREFSRRMIDITQADLRVTHGVAYIRGAIKPIKGGPTDMRKEVELIAGLEPGVKTYMLPLIQDVPGSRTPFEERRDLVFVRGFNHPQNLDAVKFFCR